MCEASEEGLTSKTSLYSTQSTSCSMLNTIVGNKNNKPILNDIIEIFCNLRMPFYA